MKQPQLSVDLAPHEQQLGKYRLVAKLGQGGMGTVYLALASGLGAFRKLLVVKELRHDLPWRESSLGMFMDEAQLAARLDHPNVLQTFEAGEADGRYFLAMEYLDGQPLSSVIDQGLPLELHIYILCEVLQGLQYAHDLTDYDGTRLHVVHRDVSPQNVFVTYHGQVKVVDFGVAKANNGSNVTSPGVFKGKFAYAAPEQLLSRPVDGRCDVFAVGVMLWEAIAGRRFGVPKPSVDAFRVRTQGLEPRIAQVTTEVDPLLAEICDHALAIDPLQRIESAEAFRVRLQEWLHLQGEHIQSKQLAAHMQERFSEERVNRRRVIEHAMVDAGASQSVIAALPQELYERESGMAAKVEPHTELSNASGISAASSTHAHAAAPASQTQGSVRLPLASERREPLGKPSFRWGGAALLVCVAAGVFVGTYQLSRRVTEAPAPQLRAAPEHETSTSNALREAEPHAPAAVSGNSPRNPQAEAEPGDQTPGADEAAQRRSGPRATTPSSNAREPGDPPATDEAARRTRPRSTTDRRDNANAQPGEQTSAADEAARRTRLRASTEDPDSVAREPGERGGRRADGARDLNDAPATADEGDRSAPRAMGARESLDSAKTRDVRERSARRATASRDPLDSLSISDLSENPDEKALRRTAAARDGQSTTTAAQGARTASAPVAMPASVAGARPKPAAGAAESQAARTRALDRAEPAAKARSGAAATRTDPGMGTDLRQLRTNGPMRIDVEDPYK